MPHDRTVDVILSIATAAGGFSRDELACLEADARALIWVDGSDGVIFDVAADGNARGFLMYSRAVLSRTTWCLDWLAVDQRVSRRGIATRLLTLYHDVIARYGARNSVIETSEINPANQAARAFYVRSGYFCFAVVPDYYSPGDAKAIYVRQF